MYMNKISLKKGMLEENMDLILEWTNSRGAAFLKQYAGDTWHFPLTKAQMMDTMETTYSIFRGHVFAGMIQVMGRNGGDVYIGRFLLDPDIIGKGVGTEALNNFCELLFEDSSLVSVLLNVYKFNEPAQRCYLKCGFVVVDTFLKNDSWSYLTMKKVR